MSVAEDMANKQAARERVEKARAEALKNPPKPAKDEYQIRAEAWQREIDEKVAAAKAKCSSFPVEPAIGMTEQQAMRCTYFGVVRVPNRVNETETAAGVMKQFVYGGGTYIYTRNGVVTAIQR